MSIKVKQIECFNKAKLERMLLFNLNLGYSFTEMGFIQKNVKKIRYFKKRTTW